MQDMSGRSQTELFDLFGKAAVVTAAGQGLGRAIALRLANAGAAVVVTHRRQEGADAVAREIVAQGGRAIGLALDVTRTDIFDDLLDTSANLAGVPTILVNCAGGMHPFTPFLDVDEAVFDATLALNLKGSYFLSQRFARNLIAANRGGRIINIASTAAFKPDYQLAAYNAAKAALIQFTRSIAIELARYEILVNAVAPGPVRTTNTEGIYDNPKVAAQLKTRIPLGGPAQSDDIAAAVLFLAADSARHMTGSTITVDGGFSCQ